MAVSSRAYSYMFCSLCGTLLDLPTTGTLAECPLCKQTRNLTGEDCGEVVSRSGPQDLMRRYGIVPIVPLPSDVTSSSKANGGAEALKERATVNELCPNCGHKELEYYTMQLRSADEGQTIFYECVRCKHKYSLNS
eukprot:TRINITY_DN38549_c0_g1_i1.p1 TRINITY_DN38549_c0_g1~~TRINITY_DN38549_c0_g1_i1.p1  ORF type:complete len:136 (-),score=13.44 TRINITY_DN38549_c0_g1_i1:485-892(-)